MRTLHWAMMASIAGVLTAGLAMPAAADHKRKHKHHHHHGYYYYPPPPPVVYVPVRPRYVAPPPVYYAPPVYAPPGVSLNVTVPLR
jgi:hypothetical protein